MELSDLRVLDLQYCRRRKVIPRNVISSLSQLEYLSMLGCSGFKWDPEGFNSREINNACLSELKHLSGFVRPEQFQFLEKWQNRNFDYKIVNFG